MLLAARGVTMTDLAASSGVSRFSVHRAYHGSKPLRLDVWVRLADALNVAVAEIAPPDVAGLIAAVA